MFLVFTLLLINIRGGTISSPSGVTSIWNSVANAAVEAKYIFSFVLETYLSTNSQIEVVFPLQYDSGLGGETLICTPTCTISDRTISFTFSEELKNGTTIVQPIMNPSTQGGTANFILRSKRGDNVIDENLIFGIIGISDSISTMVYGEITVNPTGSLYAGDYTQYILSFKTTNTIKYNSYMYFTVPDEFELEPFPMCSAYEINSIKLGGTIYCSQVNQTNVILIEGITGTITGLQEYALIISMRNPKYAGTSKTFSLGIYKTNTQMMFEEVTGITGVTIVAAQLANVSMSQTNSFINSQSRLMDYEIKFTPTFPIPSGCNIKLVFPVYMQIVQPSDFNQANQFQMHYVKYGLEDLSEDSPLGFYYLDSTQNYLRITNFKEMTMSNEICVVVRVINPSVEGYTTPLKIYVYADITEYTLLQSDVLYGIATIASTTSGNQNVVTTATSYQFTVPRSGFFPNYADYSSTSSLLADESLIPELTFNLDPSSTVPIYGYVYITVPDEFEVVSGISATQCYFNLLDIASGVTFPYTLPTASLDCSSNGQIIKAQLPFALDINQYVPQAIVSHPYRYQWQIQVLNAIYTPNLNATYFFDITLKDTDDETVLDSISFPIVISSNILSVSTIAISSIPKNQGEKSIVDISFVTILSIPSSQTQYRASDIRGFIEFHFSSAWATDLGTGLSNGDNIPCYGVNSLVPYDGNQLKCVLFLSTSTAKTIVRVSNFREISSNFKVRIMISGVVNPTTSSYSIDIKVFKKQNRIFTLLNQYTSFSVSLTSSVASTICSSSSPSYTENRVGFTFDINISPCLTATINSGNFILIQLPIYDTGFLQTNNTITCTVSTQTTQLYCIPLIGSDFILIVSPAVTAASSPIFTISNLQWPRYVQDFSSYVLNFLVINNANNNIINKYQFANLIDATPAEFSSISTLVSNRGKGFVDATYTFTFTPQSDIPENSTIVLEFPSFYDFLNGLHLPTFSQSGLQDSTTTSVSIQVNLRLIKITGFQLFSGNNTFTIKAVSVQNSNSYATASGFNIYVLYNGNYVLQQSNFFSFNFAAAFQAGKLVINQITASILNAAEVVDYSIQFTPQNDIPIGGYIKVTFPDNNYKKLPSTPDCRVSGGITTFQSCTLNGKTFIIETNSRYKAGNGVITLLLRGISNPDQGTTDGFVIETEYDGTQLDGTDESNLNGRTFTVQKKTNLITSNSLVFNPKNEGEEASYTFNFLPYASITSTSMIQFKFPDQYDPLLGRDIQCLLVSGLTGGGATCTVSDRIITLQNYDAYTLESSNPIEVTIYGIVNPNADDSTTDYLKIYIGEQGTSTFDQSNSEVAQLSFLSAPKWSQLESIDVSTYYVRWNATYNFTFITNYNIPKVGSNGAILIDFPSQFEVTDGSVTCTSTSEFASSLTCTSYRNRVTASGNYDDYVGELYVQLKKVLNPVEKGESDFFYIRTYDGLNLQIIERNFANLDPFQYTYTYPGPLIKVNNEETIVIERGTVATNIPITIEEACLLNLILIPSTNDFVVQPSQINIQLGMTLLYFNISVPQTVVDDTYTIYWTLDNELDPLLYTPVKRTLVTITKLQNVGITQNAILSIPTLGESLLTQYTLDAPPDVDLSLNLYLQQAYFAIKLSTESITLVAGQQTFGFHVLYDKSVNTEGTQVERGYITMSLAGVNQDVYTLTSTSVDFYIISQDTKAPSWETCQLTSIKKTSVILQISLSEPCVVYYLIALKGTVFPSLSEFQNQIINYASTKSQMGYIIAYTAEQQYSVELKNLVSQTEYVVHVLALDRGNNQAEKQSLIFSTLDRGLACYFTLTFNQRTVSSDFIRNVTESIATILGINNTYVQQQKYYFERRFRVLQNTIGITADEIKSYIDLELAAIPDSESFPNPTDLVAGLNNKTTLLTSKMTTLNMSDEVIAVEFTSYIPRFVKQPTIVYIDYQQCAIVVSISNYGWGFAVAVQFESHDQTIPSPYQIMSGLDYQNRPTPNGKIEISQSYQDFLITISNLTSETDYFLYVIGGSIQFKNPDLMDESDIYIDRFISFASPADPVLNIKHSSIIILQIYFIILMI